MTSQEANQILDRLKDGQDVPQVMVNIALRDTGDAVKCYHRSKAEQRRYDLNQLYRLNKYDL